MQSEQEEGVFLKDDVLAIQIPAGTEVTLTKGTEVVITQSLGGSFTVAAQGGLFRIDNQYAEILGQSPVERDSVSKSASGSVDDKIWAALKSCYDPEIPVNIVDLGLIYSMAFNEGQVEVKMTLTAPGCGMGPAIAADAKSKLEQLPEVKAAEVEVVWEPQWSPSMISDEGKQKLGIDD